MSLLSFAKKKKPAKKQAKAADKKVAAKAPARKKTRATAWPEIELFPLITEKGVWLQEHGMVSFRVDKFASKEQVARSFAAKYKVAPRAIRSMQVRGKSRRRGQTTGSTNAWKKVYVKVDDVQSLNLGI